MNNEEFDESKIRRDDEGRFANKEYSEAAGGYDALARAESLYQREPHHDPETVAQMVSNSRALGMDDVAERWTDWMVDYAAQTLDEDPERTFGLADRYGDGIPGTNIRGNADDETVRDAVIAALNHGGWNADRFEDITELVGRLADDAFEDEDPLVEARAEAAAEAVYAQSDEPLLTPESKARIDAASAAQMPAGARAHAAAVAWNEENLDAAFEVKTWGGWGGDHDDDKYFEALDKRTGARLFTNGDIDEMSAESFAAKIQDEYIERSRVETADHQLAELNNYDEDRYGDQYKSLNAQHVLETALTLHPATQRALLGDNPNAWGFEFGGEAIELLARHPDLVPDVRERILNGNDSQGWEGLAQRDDLTTAEMRALCKKGREGAARHIMERLDPARVGGDMRATVIKVARSRTDVGTDREARNAACAKIKEFLDTATPEQIADADLPKDITDRLERVEMYGTERLVHYNID